MARQLRFRGMTLPTTGSFTQKYPTIPALPGAVGRKELSGWSDCSLPLPADWSGLPSLLQGTLIQVIDGDKVIDEFVAERMPYELRTGSTVTVEGPQIAGLTQRIGIYPPDFPFENPSKRPNWIWGGPNALPDLSLAALGNIQETWMFYLERERYGLKINDATEGQIVIRYDDESDAADPISFDPSASAIKSAVESLDGITEAYVEKHEDESFTIVILNPTKLDGVDLEVVGANGFDGSIEFQKEAEGFDSLADPEPAFFVLVDAGNGQEQTEAFPWNVAARTLEGDKVGTPTGIAGLPSVNDVIVTGHGHFGSPFEVVFVDPPKIRSFRVDFSAGDVVVERQVVGRFDPSPITRSKPLDAGAGPEEQHGKYGTPDLEILTDPGFDLGDSDWVLLVNAEGRYAGAQITARVEPGGIYQASIPVRPIVDGLYTLVIRDLAGNLIAQPSPRDNFIEAGVKTKISIANVRIPDTVDEVIFRVAVTDPDPAAWRGFYAFFQEAELREGLPQTNPGDIVKTVLTHAQQQGDGIWLDVSFDNEEDSSGAAWTDDVSYQADGFAMYLSDVLNDMADLFGCEWTITPKQTPDGTLTHDLNLYMSGNAGTDKSATGPTLTVGGSVIGGQVVSRIPAFTKLVAWGAEDNFAWLNDNPAQSTYGVLTRFLDVEEIADQASLATAMTSTLNDEKTNREAISAKLHSAGSIIPFVDFDLGDNLIWQVPPAKGKHGRRVQTISWRTTKNGVEYEVQGSRIWSEEGALARAVEKLLDAPKKRRRAKAGRGGERRVVGALGAHIHTVLSSPQSLTANTPATLVWDNIGFIAPDNFPRPDFPTDTVTVQEPGYYDFKVEFGLSDFVTAGKVEIVRVRGGVEMPVWPEPSDPGIWDVTNWPTSRFSDTAKAIPCLSGDEIKVYVTVNGDVDVESAVFVGELVDRTIIQASQASLAFTTFHKPGNDPSPGTYDLPMPGVGPGDVVFAAVVSSPPKEDLSIDGWTKLGQFDGTVISGAVFYRVADGTEGGTATLTVSGAVILSAVLWRVQDPQADWGSAPPDFAIVGNSRDAPSVAVSHGPGVYWVFPVAFFSSYFGPSGPPDYEEIAYIEGTTAQGARVYVAQAKTQVGTSVDPGLFSYDHEIQASRNWHSATVAVKVTG